MNDTKDDEYYYKKYLKYKVKYLELKEEENKGEKEENEEEFIKQQKLLYILFTNSNLLELAQVGGVAVKSQPKIKKVIEPSKILQTPKRNIKMSSKLKDYELNLTPSITEFISPRSRDWIERDFENDDEIIQKLEAMQEIIDPAYVQYENYGVPIEAWISNNMLCPCCNEKSLRRYANPNTPVIDVICINPNHTMVQGVRFFQIKASNGSLFMGKPYFIYGGDPDDANTIHVGSRRFGKLVHSITPQSEPEEKKLIIGYICIRYDDISENSLRINLDRSFIVLPKYLQYSESQRKITFDGQPSTEIIDDWYYQYIEPNHNHQRIRFNTNTNNVVRLDDIIPSVIIPKNYQPNLIVIENPLIGVIM
jgi:hypothetical protein